MKRLYVGSGMPPAPDDCLSVKALIVNVWRQFFARNRLARSDDPILKLRDRQRGYHRLGNDCAGRSFVHRGAKLARRRISIRITQNENSTNVRWERCILAIALYPSWSFEIATALRVLGLVRFDVVDLPILMKMTSNENRERSNLAIPLDYNT
jgi:hypothetical protein